MGLFGHTRIYESGIDRSLDTPSTSCTSIMSSSNHTPPPSTPTTIGNSTNATISDTDTTGFSCPHRTRTFTPRIGLVAPLRIPLTEAGEPVPGAPKYTRSIRPNCLHFNCAFTTACVY
nr:unnamed protein product [Spirometra erinaceieuropaei]